MKFIQRLTSQINESIALNFKLIKNKSNTSFLIKSISRSGFFYKELNENITTKEIEKIKKLIDDKMRKCAFKNNTPLYSEAEEEFYFYINHDLMEKERVGFECYGLLGETSFNLTLQNYYSFADQNTTDYKQQISDDNLFGFLSEYNFETVVEKSLLKTLESYNIHIMPVENTTNNFIFMTKEEYEKSFLKPEEPKLIKRGRGRPPKNK